MSPPARSNASFIAGHTVGFVTWRPPPHHITVAGKTVADHFATLDFARLADFS